MNALTRSEGNIPAVITGMTNAMKALAGQDGQSAPLFINLPSKTGKWSVGRDQEALPAGTKVVMDPEALEIGWVAWYGGKNIANVMVDMLSGQAPEKPVADDEGKPLPSDVDPKTGEPLCKVSPQYVMGVTLEGGLRAIIRGGSVGFKFAIEDVLQKIVLRARAGETKLCPVLELAVGSYTNAYGKQYPPKFNVVGWM